MSAHPRPLLAHQQRALAAAAGLVGRPRLRAGLALTLACACGPINDDGLGDSDTSLGVAESSSTLAPTTGDSSSSGHDDPAQTTTASTSSDTLLTDASTTLATTTTGSDTTGTSTSSDTGDTTGTGGLDDCFLDRTAMEVDWACCEAQNWMPAPQCTPWGPPAPPVAEGRLPAARRARQVLA